MPELADNKWSTESRAPDPPAGEIHRGSEGVSAEVLGRRHGAFRRAAAAVRMRARARSRRARSGRLTTWCSTCIPELFAWGLLVVPKDLQARRAASRGGLPARAQRPPAQSARWRQKRLQQCRRRARGARIHHLRAAQSLSRRRPLPLARSQGEHGARRRSSRSSSRSTIRSCAGSGRCHSWTRSASASTASATAARRRCACRRSSKATALSICSGDFNQWTRKVASTDEPFSFMRTIEWEMPYWNLGHTFDYAEMAYLMVPRPFMVERGHHDRVGRDQWVAHEYAKVRWLYAQLGLADRTRDRVLPRRPRDARRRHVRLPP